VAQVDWSRPPSIDAMLAGAVARLEQSASRPAKSGIKWHPVNNFPLFSEAVRPTVSAFFKSLVTSFSDVVHVDAEPHFQLLKPLDVFIIG